MMPVIPNTQRSFKKALDELRLVGLRPTRQRLALAKLLFEGGNRHVTAENLHAEARACKVRVSLATVYNSLHQFTAVGLLREIFVDPQRLYFDTNIAVHHHFFHEGSGSLEDIPGDQVVVSLIPSPPDGTVVKSVEVIVRVGS
jgi:Fur family iron response transcriptional regulator